MQALNGHKMPAGACLFTYMKRIIQESHSQNPLAQEATLELSRMPMPWGLAWLVFYQGNLGFLCFQDPQEDEARLRTLIYKRWPLPLNERSEKLARSDGQAVLDY